MSNNNTQLTEGTDRESAISVTALNEDAKSERADVSSLTSWIVDPALPTGTGCDLQHIFRVLCSRACICVRV